MNETFQRLINGLAGQNSILDGAMRAAADSVYLVVPALIILWLWPSRRRASNQRIAIVTFAGVVLGLLVAVVLRHFYFEPRPFISRPATTLLVNHAPNNAFPSEHTTAAFAIAGALLPTRRVIGLVALGVASLTAFARVYVGVHWPVDVAASAVIGFVSGTAATAIGPYLVSVQARFSRVLPGWLIAAPTKRQPHNVVLV